MKLAILIHTQDIVKPIIIEIVSSVESCESSPIRKLKSQIRIDVEGGVTK